MDTETKGPERFSMPTEVPVRAGRIQFDYKLGWAAGFAAIGILGMVASSLAGMPLFGILWILLLIAAYFLFVGVPLFDGGKKSALTKTSTVAAQRFYDTAGWSEYRANHAGIGEGFDKSRRPFDPAQLSHSKMIGKVLVKPFYVDGDGSEPLGVAYDRQKGTMSSTLWVDEPPLINHSPDQASRKRTVYGELLATLDPVASNVCRFSWRTQTFLHEPIDASALKQAIAGKSPSMAKGGIFDDVVADLAERSVRHMTTMTLTLSRADIKKESKRLGSSEHVLAEEVQKFINAITETAEGTTSAQALSYNQLVGVARVLADPTYVEGTMPSLMQATPGQTLLEPELAWSKYYDFKSATDTCKVGQTYHRYYYVYVRDRSPILVEHFKKMHEVKVPKVITTVIQPISRRQAQRRAQLAANAAFSGNTDRTHDGKRVSGADQSLERQAVETEMEIVDEDSLTGRTRSYVDISGSTEEQCASYAREFELAVAATPLVLAPLEGRQAEGLGATLPLGRGLATIPISKQWL